MTAFGSPRHTAPASYAWLRGLRVYLGITAIGNLIWEALQLPLYSIWNTGTFREQAFAVAHCTLGDLLIALTSLTLALLLAGSDSWPRDRFWLVAILTSSAPCIPFSASG